MIDIRQQDGSAMSERGGGMEDRHLEGLSADRLSLYTVVSALLFTVACSIQYILDYWE